MTLTRPPRGERVLLVVKVTLCSLYGAQLLWIVPALFRDPVSMPGWLWTIGALVPLLGLALTWRVEERVPRLTFFLQASAVLTGLGGAFWQAWTAPVIGVVTLLGLLVAPREKQRS